MIKTLYFLQRTITEMEVGDEDTAVTAPALLAQLLIRITPQLMADAEALISSELSTTAGHSSDIDVHMDGNITASGSPGLRGLHRSHSSQPCTPAGTAYKRSHSSNPATVSSSAGRCSDNFANLPAEWRQFQNLFNEVPIVRTRHIAADIASAACEGSHLSQYGSQSTQEDDDKGHSDESRQQQHNKQHEQAEMEIIRAVIGTPELCTAALKTLISISNDNPDAARVLVEESDADGLLAWAVAMLAWCTAWRSCLEDRQIFATSKTTSGGGASAYVGSSKALSPDETRLEVKNKMSLFCYCKYLIHDFCCHPPFIVCSASYSIRCCTCSLFCAT